MRSLRPIHITNVVMLPKDDDEAVDWVREHCSFVDDEGTERKLYTDVGDHLLVPRGAWRGFTGKREYDDQTSLAPARLPAPLKPLRPYQNKPVGKMLKAKGGVLDAPTGSGKTWMMLVIASALQQRTLILVHTKDLLDQWIGAVRDTLGMEAGIIGDGQWEEADITIGMVQTLMQYEQLPVDWLCTWGTVIHDEVHRVAADSFLHVMGQMTARHLYGATATTTRRDHLEPIMEAVIGPVMAKVDEDKLVKAGALIKPTVEMVETKFYSADGARMTRARNQWQRQTLYGKMITELALDPARMKLVARRVVKLKDGHQLVLSERIEHLYGLEQAILDRDPSIRTFVVTGKMPKSERTAVIQQMRDGHLDVLLATQLADEGLDLPVLDVLHLTFPRRATQKLQQQVGRIMRSALGKEACRVLDYVDSNVPVLVTQATVRWKWYAEEKDCQMTGWMPKGALNIKKRMDRIKANKRGNK